MKRLLSLFLIFCLVAACISCGNIFVAGTFQPGFSTVTGFISIVQLTTVIDHGTTVVVTFVTFVQSGASSTIGFCGDQRPQFPISQLVRTDFTPGQPCSSILLIVIL